MMTTLRPSRAGYEFSAEENETFARLVRNMARSGLVVVIASLILLGYHVVAYFGVSLGKAAAPMITSLDYAVWTLISLIGVVIGVLLIRATAVFAAAPSPTPAGGSAMNTPSRSRVTAMPRATSSS